MAGYLSGGSVKRLVAPGLLMLAGFVFLVATIVENLFAVGSDFEEMIDDFRPILTDQSIAGLRADLVGLDAAAVEFQTRVVPAMADRLGMTPEAFDQLVETEFPAVADGLALLLDTGPTFAGLIDLLDQQQDNFRGADAIPTENLPAETMPWGFTAVGALAVALGVYLFWRPSLPAAISAIVIGLLIAVGSFVVSLPDKSGDADDLNAALEPVYTVGTVEEAEAALGVLGAMGREMATEMLPALARRLGMSPGELGGFLAENFPATAQGLQTLPAALGPFRGLVDTFDANLDNYDTLQPVKFTPITWILIIGGGVIALAGGLALLRRDEEEAPTAAMHLDAEGGWGPRLP